MTAQKCVVEGCNLEYDVICSFSFYNVNTSSELDGKRQEWIDGAMKEDSECLWRHVSLQLCGYHFELDSQGLWIDSPMLPELLTCRASPPPMEQSAADKKGSGYQNLFEKFITVTPKAAEMIRLEHSYSAEAEVQPAASRLNVRHLVDTLGYLSLKSLQRKQLWVVKVEADKAEASITQAEQVIAKMTDPKQMLEIVPQTSTSETVTDETETVQTEQHEVLQMIDDPTIPDNFIYEIAEEQEITMEEVKEIPPETSTKDWTLNVVPDESKPKYAYIKHCATGKKKRHFTAEMNEITLQGDFENYYILPDVDPSSGVEITTSYEPENYIVEEYQHLVLEERPKKRQRETDPTKKRKKKVTPMRDIKEVKYDVGEDWVIQNDIVYEQPPATEEFEDKKGRVKRRNKKYLGYDFAT